MTMASNEVADLIRDVNASNEAVEDQCLRACQAADIAARSARLAGLSAVAAKNATIAHRTVQDERPRRRAPLPRQVIFALMTVALDGVACYFAAQALDGSQDATWYGQVCSSRCWPEEKLPWISTATATCALGTPWPS